MAVSWPGVSKVSLMASRSDRDPEKFFLQMGMEDHIFHIWLPDRADRSVLHCKKSGNHTVQEIVKKFSELFLLPCYFRPSIDKKSKFYLQFQQLRPGINTWFFLIIRWFQCRKKQVKNCISGRIFQ